MDQRIRELYRECLLDSQDMNKRSKVHEMCKRRGIDSPFTKPELFSLLSYYNFLAGYAKINDLSMEKASLLWTEDSERGFSLRDEYKFNTAREEGEKKKCYPDYQSILDIRNENIYLYDTEEREEPNKETFSVGTISGKWSYFSFNNCKFLLSPKDEDFTFDVIENKARISFFSGCYFAAEYIKDCNGIHNCYKNCRHDKDRRLLLTSPETPMEMNSLHSFCKSEEEKCICHQEDVFWKISIKKKFCDLGKKYAEKTMDTFFRLVKESRDNPEIPYIANPKNLDTVIRIIKEHEALYGAIVIDPIEADTLEFNSIFLASRNISSWASVFVDSRARLIISPNAERYPESSLDALRFAEWVNPQRITPEKLPQPEYQVYVKDELSRKVARSNKRWDQNQRKLKHQRTNRRKRRR